ncbi:hypothetical protein A1Q2_08035 [Trichosporon asahii var. asahii CBS 8904]|uniref:Uncharacterized protein n=2 Tax=Trichosporon asahii var. asahii TaxID=189963 RepID=K1V191_TRIAC|nr:hypothetical protein A1Q1_02003 [Trichosporon asahii var. asahii CBS 2479]EJT48908.1 hypothetical protein A1Q1_02003 [Trichosporon asahii var. asahii CBS 2479]EKC97654.1 hypothetical protein A1Q2_08035 [Trichosporon asahii var. asahii CBS 8904]
MNLDLSWLEELAPLQVPDDGAKPPKKKRKRPAVPPKCKPPPPRRAPAAKPAGRGRIKPSTATAATAAPVKSAEAGPSQPAASSHGQRGRAHDQRQKTERHPAARTKAGFSATQEVEISDRHFLGAPDGVNRVVQGRLPTPPPVRAGIAEMIVIDSDSAPEPELETERLGKRRRTEGKGRGRARAPPKPKVTTKAQAAARSKPKPPPKIKTPKPKAVKGVKGGKRMLRKTREASPSPLSSPPPLSPLTSPHAAATPSPFPTTPVLKKLKQQTDELNFVLPAHRLFVGRPARSPFLFGTEGPWSAENLAWIEGRELEEVRPKKWVPQFWK